MKMEPAIEKTTPQISMDCNRSFLTRLVKSLRKIFQSRRILTVDRELVQSLEAMAAKEGQSLSEFAGCLMDDALTRRLAEKSIQSRWPTLTPREQQTVSLLCQGYRNQQIADLLVISPDTVKIHIRNAMVKLGVHTKEQLRSVLRNWDFGS